ncbi:hypothetical protein Asi02nite_77280 [Asanoa siamensis]|uniref:Uncharacterized protein n=1 Tax=Asanoa siamensis TaxID=926357 RepID=A0ABQ4D3U0_9ACTN|nr:hypothetical protein Asi02nite_77280 [Asanoa siamensis]
MASHVFVTDDLANDNPHGRLVGASVRAVIVAAAVAFIISLFGTPVAIRVFMALKAGQRIRSIGPATHLKKKGNSTTSPRTRPRSASGGRVSATPFHPRGKESVVDVYAGSRPALWIDDAHTPEGRAWAATRRPSTLLIEHRPGYRPTRADIDRTPLARSLAAEHRALRLTPDDWMIRLFGESDAYGRRYVLEGRLVPNSPGSATARWSRPRKFPVSEVDVDERRDLFEEPTRPNQPAPTTPRRWKVTGTGRREPRVAGRCPPVMRPEVSTSERPPGIAAARRCWRSAAAPRPTCRRAVPAR